jgi:hypothetical protein
MSPYWATTGQGTGDGDLDGFGVGHAGEGSKVAAARAILVRRLANFIVVSSRMERIQEAPLPGQQAGARRVVDT